VRTLLDFLDYLNLAVFTLAAIVALVQWRAGRGRGAFWAAAAFVTLAFVADAGRLFPEDDETFWSFVALHSLIALLVLFPYFLYRFTTSFQPPTRQLERLLGLMTVVVLVWTYVLPDIPEEGEPRSAGWLAYLVAFLIHWTTLSVVVTVRLWRAGRGQPNVARRRMQLLAVASAAITVAIFFAAFGDGDDDSASVFELLTALIATASAVAFLLGLWPPWMLRALWRRPEVERVQAAIADLMGATSEREIADRVLEPMADLVGARAVALRDTDGRVIGSHGASAKMLAAADAGRREIESGEVMVFEIPSGSLLVWTTPYAPFFGHDELATLRTLGALTGLALDRARLFAVERDARVALERADEVKTNFVALAAHELRTPVATIDGIVGTLATRGDMLPPDQRQLLEDTLRQQSGHMRQLVDQLLDLSRLDAEAVAIEPRALAVRDHVESVVNASAAAANREKVVIEIEPDLEAMADATAFDRIVANLVVNALRHGEPPIVVSAERRDRHFRLAVQDHGPGVPAEFVPDLFERFTRSRQAGERVAGTGLGLAIARSYAKAHGGDLLYESGRPRGARFQLVLPVEPVLHGATETAPEPG
jgi:signal transduction histidine kinase